jgi:hypothetical protein
MPRYLFPKESSIAVDHENKYIYIHIPKTAGTSVRQSLKEAPWPHLSRGTKFRVPKHATALTAKQIVGERIWQSHFTFAFVRNPWDLMVSSYHWWLRKGKRYDSTHAMAELVEQCGTFHDFVLGEIGSTHINEFEAQGLKDWCCNDQGVVLLDFIGRFEEIEKDFQHIGERLGVNFPELPRKNVSNRSSYREYYNDETRQAVADRFTWTIQNFKYEF